MNRRKRVAYHEAGHAVIGRVLALPCGSATIVPDYDVNTVREIPHQMREIPHPGPRRKGAACQWHVKRRAD
jgi:hypothetical protein